MEKIYPRTLTNMKVFASAGAEIVLTNTDGEILGQIPIEPGIRDLTEHQELMRYGFVELRGVKAMTRGTGRMQTQVLGDDAYKTAANAEYKPLIGDEHATAVMQLVERVVDRREKINNRKRLKEAERAQQRQDEKEIKKPEASKTDDDNETKSDDEVQQVPEVTETKTE